MKDIEDIIGNGQEEFNSDEPSVNHINNFLNKLDMQESRRKSGKIYKIISFVASAAAILILVVTIFRFSNQPVSEEGMMVNMPEELQEIEYYFQAEIERSLIRLETDLANCPQQKKEVFTCFKEIDESLKPIQKDYMENPGNEQVKNAIINHYQAKLDVVNQIINSTSKYCI